MARNVEIKAHVRDPARFRELVEVVSDTAPVTIRQEDIFFDSPQGRLKLRKFPDGSAELIHYHRPDSVEPVGSEYTKAPIEDPLSLEEVLSRALGVRGVVRKSRKLYRVGPTRIHFDRVEGLGNFMELEVVVAPGEDSESAIDVAKGLMARLAIAPEDLIESAYIDLIEAMAAVE